MSQGNAAGSTPSMKGVYLLTASLALAAAVVVALGWDLLDVRGIDWWWLAGGIVAVTAMQSGPALMRFRGRRTESISHDEIVFPFLLVFVGPAGAVLSMLVGTVLSNAVARRAPRQLFYNASQFTLAAAVGGVGFAAVDAALDGRFLAAAALVGVVGFSATEIASYMRLLHHLTGEPWWTLLRSDLREEGRRLAAELALGVVLAVAVEATPSLAPLALVAAVVVLGTHRRWFLLTRDRERLGDLLSATTSLHGAATVDQVRASLIGAVRLMVGADAEFAPEEAGSGERLALPVDTGADEGEWLLVSRSAPFEDTEVVIVETLVRVAEVSMRMAALLESYVAQSELLTVVAEQRESFLTGVAHQLRTPLTVVLGFGATIVEEPGDPEAVGMMAAEVVREASEMSNILDNLLIAPRASIDALLVTPAEVELAKELRSVAVEFDPSGGIAVSGSGRAVGDPLRVRQVARNLIRNALNHGREPVEVVVGRLGERTWVDVFDAGPGLQDEDTESMFLPFTHGDFVDGQPGATGLGLYAARQVARLMNGNVSYRREDGRTVFRLELPAAQPSRRLVLGAPVPGEFTRQPAGRG